MYSENKSHCKKSLFNFIITKIFLIDRDLCMQVDLDPMLRGENSWKESLGRSRLFTTGPTPHCCQLCRFTRFVWPVWSTIVWRNFSKLQKVFFLGFDLFYNVQQNLSMMTLLGISWFLLIQLGYSHLATATD